MENNKNKKTNVETITIVDEYGCIVSIEFIHEDGTRNKFVFDREREKDDE